MILTHLRSSVVVLAIAAVCAPAAAQDDAAATGRRLATVASIAAEEYALGVAGGRVVSPAELEEAVLFLSEARRLADALPGDVAGPVAARLDDLLEGAERRDDPGAIAVGVAAVRELLVAGLGISLDPMPSQAPSLARGAEIYAASCAACHGVSGAADGPAAAALDPPPTAFTDLAALSAATPLEFFRKISVGIAGTAMVGFESTLSVDERWAVALYVSGLRYAAGDREAGQQWMTARCPGCLVEFADAEAYLDVSDDSLAAVIAAVSGGTRLPEAVAFARTAGAAEVLGADPTLLGRRAILRTRLLVDEAAVLAGTGDRDAAGRRALDAYLAFEAVEVDVGARSGGAVAGVEQAFAGLRVALADGDGAAVAGAVAATGASLDAAEAVLTGESGSAVLFAQSLVIILREGLEALLIIGALSAVLVRAGAPGRRRDLATGVGLAVVASVGTAVVFATVLQVTLAQREAIEGVTMLLASVVLFSVASWMVSKVEAERWKAFVQTQMTEALRSTRALALIGIAFLAVYREGVETILFYAALLGTADSRAGVTAVALGFGVGVLALGLLYVAMQRWGVRIPVRPFFAVTGILLTVMAVSFAGQGVAELQAAGWVPTTPLRLPAVPALGLFPTVQTLLAQLGFGLAFLVAVVWVLGVRPAPAPARSER